MLLQLERTEGKFASQRAGAEGFVPGKTHPGCWWPQCSRCRNLRGEKRSCEQGQSQQPRLLSQGLCLSPGAPKPPKSVIRADLGGLGDAPGALKTPVPAEMAAGEGFAQLEVAVKGHDAPGWDLFSSPK